MPGWIWLVLAMLMLCIFLAGCWYAFRRASAAARVMSSLSSAISQRLGPAQNDPGDRVQEPPIFTQPLSTASDRYAQAHARKIERKAQAHERHRAQWSEWKAFNE
ncbi:hypothetical protein KIM372_09260 [Bombiscardovia nodaiensis]|uniref:Uncharacterized protein n=1 Tax=Bombiscardovia nodaiensis TaxID=2932181 RepID=A0ABM8B823_9BIFI|nr:hypothetical protein KIM372_09260 [Bombiscardovia nodaiensis]